MSLSVKKTNVEYYTRISVEKTLKPLRIIIIEQFFYE